MKYLVFALCVCAASAASVQNNDGFYKPWQVKATAKAEVVPVAEPVQVIQPIQPIPTIQSFQPVQPLVKTVVPTYKEATAQILRYDSEVNPDSYNYNYETENGISAEASGALKKVNEGEVLTMQGAYKFIATDGTVVEVRYIADENGFQPQSNALPVGPPTPDYILRSLEYIRTHSPVEVKKL